MRTLAMIATSGTSSITVTIYDCYLNSHVTVADSVVRIALWKFNWSYIYNEIYCETVCLDSALTVVFTLLYDRKTLGLNKNKCI